MNGGGGCPHADWPMESQLITLMTVLSAPRQKQLKLKSVSDPVSKSHGDNFLHLDEDLKVPVNSFKSFAARERMVLLASKKYPGRPLEQAENETRCRIWEENGWRPETRSTTDEWPRWHICPSGPRLQ